MNNLPVNDTKGNISTIYYDPLVIGFYEARVNFILEICIIPIGVGIMVYFISYKKKQAIKSVKEE